LAWNASPLIAWLCPNGPSCASLPVSVCISLFWLPEKTD
jgi:hypothetical protein